MNDETDAPLRSPAEILKAMDKEGVRNNPNLLTQMQAELGVSLAVAADRVSQRNLTIATLSCVVAVIALGISLLQFYRPTAALPADAAAYPDLQQQVDAYNEQMRISNDQISRNESLLARTEAQMTKAEQQVPRMDALLAKWEAQAKSQEEILAAVRLLLEKADTAAHEPPAREEIDRDENREPE